ncbi:MAG: Gfo/Idh/MocA family oxidoreductase [Solirubrobacteraceae bacterium]
MGVSVRVGLAGYGLAGAVFHEPLIASVDGLEPAGVATRSKGNLDELLGAIDALVVATPNASHVEVATAALERGLFVVVDKPLAPTAAAARALVHERLTVFQNRRWDGDFLTVQRLVREGFFGGVTRFESRFERFRPEVAGVWRESADEGGGVLLDLGAHLVDQAIVLFGPPVHVHGEVAARRPGATVDDDVFIALEHAGGERSHLWMSLVTPSPGPRFRVNGLADGFVSEGMDPQEAQLRDGMLPGDPGFGEREGLDAGRYADFYAGVRDWVRGEGPRPVDPADAVRVLEVLEAARG